MSRYAVAVTESNRGVAYIEAESREDAMDKAYEAYENGEFQWYNTNLSGFEAKLDDSA